MGFCSQRPRAEIREASRRRCSVFSSSVCFFLYFFIQALFKAQSSLKSKDQDPIFSLPR